MTDTSNPYKLTIEDRVRVLEEQLDMLKGFFGSSLPQNLWSESTYRNVAAEQQSLQTIGPFLTVISCWPS